METRTDCQLSFKDGRILSYAEYGDPKGIPLIAFHGMPGSRYFGSLFDVLGQKTPFRIISPERPGCGMSSPKTDARLGQYPDDIVQLVESLQLEKFMVMGVSGGGPSALACAAKIRKGLVATAVVSGIGQIWMPQATQGMIINNRIFLTLGRYSPLLASFLLSRLMHSSLSSMEKHITNGTSPSPDIAPEVFAVVVRDQREAIHNGAQGLRYDMRTILHDWGFALEDIHSKVFLWHGAADNLAPASMAQHIADQLPNCEAVFYPGEGHLDSLLKHSNDIMQKLLDMWYVSV